MLNFTDQHKVYVLKWRCPFCNKRILKPRLYRPDGSRLSLFKVAYVSQFSDRSTLAECPKCGQRWPIFQQPDQPAAINYAVETVETSRSESPVGEERRVIDNTRSPAPMERRFTVSREWIQSYEVDDERVETVAGGISVGVDGVGRWKTAAESAIKQRYAITEAARQTYEEQITIQVPAGVKLTVSLAWKQIWQHGTIRLLDPETRALVGRVPYTVAVGLTFDQTQWEEGGA